MALPNWRNVGSGGDGGAVRNVFRAGQMFKDATNGIAGILNKEKSDRTNQAKDTVNARIHAATTTEELAGIQSDFDNNKIENGQYLNADDIVTGIQGKTKAMETEVFDKMKRTAQKADFEQQRVDVATGLKDKADFETMMGDMGNASKIDDYDEYMAGGLEKGYSRKVLDMGYQEVQKRGQIKLQRLAATAPDRKALAEIDIQNYQEKHGALNTKTGADIMRKHGFKDGSAEYLKYMQSVGATDKAVTGIQDAVNTRKEKAVNKSFKTADQNASLITSETEKAKYDSVANIVKQAFINKGPLYDQLIRQFKDAAGVNRAMTKATKRGGFNWNQLVESGGWGDIEKLIAEDSKRGFAPAGTEYTGYSSGVQPNRNPMARQSYFGSK